MAEYENFGAFIKDNKQLLQEYAETRLELYRLQGARQAAKLGGYLIWVAITLFLLLLVLIFCGITLGYWFSSITGSNVAGFGLATIMLVLMILLITLLRKRFFVNPIVRNIVKQLDIKDGDENEDD
jgi:uncharacterized membrane protein